MSHARIEEVSDSDPEIDDPSSFLPSSSQHALQPMEMDTPAPSQRQQQSNPNPTLLSQPPPMSYHNDPQTGPQTRAAVKSHCTLYPLYFDSTRTRSGGRRVTRSLAIPNPLAYNLLLALRHILSTTPPHTPLQLTLEPDKTHPKDWANPGRVRVRLFSSAEDGHKPLHPAIPNKARLYTLIGQYLKDHPTKREDPLELKIPGLPVPENFLSEEGKIVAPRGWRMGSVLPVHSAAVSGGGVSENFFKEAMEEMKAMQGAGGAGGGGGMPDMSALQSMMGNMGGMGGLGGLMGGGGAGGGGAGGGGASGGGSGDGGKKAKGRKKG
ncbi:uncharacterized protein HMPREF1541_01724 [Cyphellophora europaea CBS 101466]|uniref:Signal recognition particle SEC65 subunit n=1 Tax=Cyphellophora europaea (strain CBS 101466) TaxID=1220924 RepID=W2S1L0_CYPE1|nr:uncharacterized protein HMPREF1541_01724 [Cyphellophora europaea CBS 101466]ETN42567.1 hypothetical protein HMPREF1541_01724 [Cyphellophora europaea CBS 101466]